MKKIVGKGRENVQVKDLYVGAFIKAVFLNSLKDDKWHKVYAVNIQGDKVYIAVEEYGGITLPKDYEVEVL